MRSRWSETANARTFEPETGDERLEALRLMPSSKEPARIDGVFVEYHWARMILELYDQLGLEAQRQLAATRTRTSGGPEGSRRSPDGAFHFVDARRESHGIITVRHSSPS
jgi:hypothetical protein